MADLKQVMSFLRDLQKNNTRDWMQDNLILTSLVWNLNNVHFESIEI
jgi:hypothetical protein